MGKGYIVPEVGVTDRNLFFDAARFRENCFCAGFIFGCFAPLSARGKHRQALFPAFFGCCGKGREGGSSWFCSLIHFQFAAECKPPVPARKATGSCADMAGLAGIGDNVASA